MAARRRAPSVQPADDPLLAECGAHQQLPDLQAVFGPGGRSVARSMHVARVAGFQAGGGTDPAGRGGAGGVHSTALQVGRDVLRFDQQGSARNAGDCHEPHRRQEQHRRRRRRSRPLRAGRQRRLAQQRDQAGGFGPLRRHQPVPGQRARTADQDGARRQTRRRRPAAGAQGLPVDRQGAPFYAGRGVDFAAAPPRHLFD